MRRAAAHLALATIWLGSLVQLLAVAQVSAIHACCLRNGKHHCQGPDADGSPGAEFRATSSVAPYSAPLSPSSFSGMEIGKFRLTSPVSDGLVAAHNSVYRSRSAVFRLHAARAPPAFFS
jgi:hypothetical protein